tara:strand:- start:238 stop:852 length:615 start_codon:yes stop_codon:yes gene_type:complete
MKVEEFFSEGFRLAKPEYWTIIFNCLIYLIVGIVALFSVVGWLALPSLVAGFTRFTLRAARGEEVDVGDSMSWAFKDGMWSKSLVYGVVSTLGILIGFMLLIIPGLYLLAAWALGWFLLVEERIRPMEALARSRELVHEVGFWKVFITIIVLQIGIQLIQLISPTVGPLLILFLYPLIVMIYVSIFEHAIKGDAQAIDADFQEN